LRADLKAKRKITKSKGFWGGFDRCVKDPRFLEGKKKVSLGGGEVLELRGFPNGDVA
jgi:hypothetical protein